MGSGGMIVLDEDDCMVDIAKFFIDLLAGRVVRQVYALPRRQRADAGNPRTITSGKADLEDLDKLKRLAC